MSKLFRFMQSAPFDRLRVRGRGCYGALGSADGRLASFAGSFATLAAI